MAIIADIVTEGTPISPATDLSTFDRRFADVRERLLRICIGLVGADEAEDVIPRCLPSHPGTHRPIERPRAFRGVGRAQRGEPLLQPPSFPTPPSRPAPAHRHRLLEIWRVIGRGEVELYVDATHDHGGSLSWQLYRCTSIDGERSEDDGVIFLGLGACDTPIQLRAPQH